MSKIDFLNRLAKCDCLLDSDLHLLYKLDAESYDYENHKHNSKIEEILNMRDIRRDISCLCNCLENEVAYLDEEMSPNTKYLYTGLHIVDLQTHEVLNGKTVDMKKFLNYKESDINEDDLIQNCQNKSISTEPIVVRNKPIIKMVSEEEAKNKIKIAVKCLSGAAAAIVAITLLPEVGTDADFHKFLDEHRYLVSNEKVRTDDNSGYYYLHNNIAKNVLNSNEDFDSVLYAVYSTIKQDAATLNGHDDNQIDYNMDLIVKDLSYNSDKYNYSNFDEYLVSKNFINEQGNPDSNTYDKMMHDYIINMLENNNLTFDGGKTR